MSMLLLSVLLLTGIATMTTLAATAAVLREWRALQQRRVRRRLEPRLSRLRTTAAPAGAPATADAA